MICLVPVTMMMIFSNHNQDGLNSAEIETEENVEVPLQPVLSKIKLESEKATISIDKKTKILFLKV